MLDDLVLQGGVSLWTIFERNLELFRRKDKTDIATRLVIAGSNDSRSALVTPPDQTPSRNATDFALHARPRLDMIDALWKITPPPQAHGGLSPGAMRRAQDYVEANLSHAIDLTTLAAVAGLSIHHFERGFRQSAGIAPHQYLIQKRVERAGDMLANTDLALPEIAYAVGFSDQSHLARHFRRMFGITPGSFGGRNARV